MRYDYSYFRERFANTPIIDAHTHVMHRKIGQWADGSIPCRATSRLAGVLTGYSSLLCFYAAGMSADEANRIRSGEYDREACKHAVLKCLPLCGHMIPVACTIKGIEELYGITLDEINGENWDEIDELLASRYQDEVSHFRNTYDKCRIEKAMLNMWAGWGASYYGEYLSTMSPAEREMDERCFARVATFDSYAMDPFSPVTQRYADMVSGEYCDFIGALADYFVRVMKVKAFKFTECYFRPLDYAPVDRSRAKACFMPRRNAAECKDWSDYISWLILEQARRLGVPVQIHTGELWGDTQVAAVNPIFLVETIKAFPDVKFDLLHGGYPFMGETGIMATNLRNVYINMAYVPVHSLRHTEIWLDIYLNSASADRILMGTDLFDLEPMAGCVRFIRECCARQASYMTEAGIASPRSAQALFEKILYGNAVQLYNLTT